MKSGQIDDARKSSRSIVLANVRKHGRVARIDIANETGISPANVTGISAELLSAGLIEEVARANKNEELKRGRPRVDLMIRGEAHFVAGVKIADQSAVIAILDFGGELVSEYSTPLPSSKMTCKDLVAFLPKVLQDATAQADLTMGQLSGIGLGLAGVIDAPRGYVHWSPSIVERNLPLRELLVEHLDVPLFIDNDVNLVALAEQWFGLGKSVSDFIVITIENGVGMGIVINDEIYRGTRGCGAEFGHTKVQLDGALCRCGQRGCLEAYVADYALLREANYAASSTNISNSPTPEQQVQDLFHLAKAGDQTAQSIFKRAGKMFAMGLANVINIFDPALIILSGERMQFDYLYAGEVIENMKNSVVQIDVSPPDVRIHKWGDLMWAKGAAVYAMEGVTEISLQGMASNGK